MSHIPGEAGPHLLLIDDDVGQLTRLSTAIKTRLAGRPATIVEWTPARGEVFRDELARLLHPRPTLVVTDYDLTENGPSGMMGGSVVSWFRAHAVPVGDYSRKLADELQEPELFDFRFSNEPGEAAVQVVDLLTGFCDLAGSITRMEGISPGNSWSVTLARLLGRDSAASSFSLYSARTGASHAEVIERLSQDVGRDEARQLLAVYVLGHLLRNGVLRYPGPIMSRFALCSYLAISDDATDAASELFAEARYDGPFGGRGYFWQEDVDGLLADLAERSGLDGNFDDATFRRALVATNLDPGTHGCQHCPGDRGGYRCPYTDRTVCDRADCSVPTSSWIPPGAYLTRVDRDYFDSWAPLLGL